MGLITFVTGGRVRPMQRPPCPQGGAGNRFEPHDRRPASPGTNRSPMRRPLIEKIDAMPPAALDLPVMGIPMSGRGRKLDGLRTHAGEIRTHAIDVTISLPVHAAVQSVGAGSREPPASRDGADPSFAFHTIERPLSKIVHAPRCRKARRGVGGKGRRMKTNQYTQIAPGIPVRNTLFARLKDQRVFCPSHKPEKEHRP